MKFNSTIISGMFVINLEPKADSRGFLARSWDRNDFVKHGLVFDPTQGYTCFTKKKGTIRGFHSIIAPHQETKLTRVISGALYEVVIDLRPDSQTYKQWLGFTFHASDYKMLVTPPGCAHAVLTLVDDTEYTSLYSPSYDPIIEKGLRYDDPAFGIIWPIPVEIVSEKDKNWPDYKK